MQSRPPFLLRGLARAIDLGVQITIMEFAGRAAVYLPAEGLWTPSEDVLFWIEMAVGVAALLAYTTLAEWLGGATFGKFCTGMRVVRANGEAVDPLAALVRNLGLFVDSLFFGFVAYSAVARSETRQRLGDQWADTLVVWKSDAPERSGVIGWSIGAAAAFAIVVASYLVAT